MDIDSFGVFVYLLSILAIAGLLAKFGLDTVAMRYFAAYREQNATGLLLGLALLSFLWVGLLALVVYFGLIYAVRAFNILPSDYAANAPLLLGLLPLLPLQNLVAAMLRGLDAPLLAELVDTTLRYSLILIGLTALWLSDAAADVRIIVWIYTAATALCFAFGLTMVWRKWPYQLGQAGRMRPAFRLPEWGAAGAALSLTGGLYLLMNQADLQMLGYLAAPENVARYGVASRLTGIVAMGLGAVMIVVAPKLSAIHARGGPRFEMQALLTSAAKLTFIIIAIGAIGLAALGKPLLLLFGPEFGLAYVPLMILMASRVVEAFAGPVGQLLAMVGMHTLVAVLLILPASLNIALNMFLIPRYEEAGAALATVVSAVVWNITLLYVSRRKLGLDPSLLSIRRVKKNEGTPT
jgi:O-antigen/teichoic acid export membrane protein